MRRRSPYGYWVGLLVLAAGCGGDCAAGPGGGAAPPRRIVTGTNGASEQPVGDPAVETEVETQPETADEVAVGGPEKPPTSSPTKPSIVLVLIDTLRPDYLGFYGFERETAPFMAALATEAVVFDNAYSTSSWTAPSTASLFTSLYPPQHGVVQGFRAHRDQIAKLDANDRATMKVNSMPDSFETLSEQLKDAGYRTYGFSSNINIGPELGFRRGFDHFVKEVRAPAENFYASLNEMKDEILGGDGPFFVYLHLNDVHSPYEKRAPFYQASSDEREDARQRYRSEISYVDAQLKKIFELIVDRREMVYAIVSDHGEEFWDHGKTMHGPQLYRELSHVLFMFGVPGATPRRITANVSLVDIYPTLARLAGFEASHQLEGLSLTPLFTAEDDAKLVDRLNVRTLFAHRIYSTPRDLYVWAAMHRGLRLVDWWGERHKLFDERKDPGNVSNLASELPEVTESLTTRLELFKERMERVEEQSDTAVEIELDETLIKRLERLGYVE